MIDRTLLGRRKMLGMGGILALGGLGGGALAGPALAADKGIPAHVVNTAGNAALVLQELIRQQGFFGQLGLDAETINVGDGSKIMGSLLSGAEDITILTGFSQVLPAIEKGGGFKLVAGANQLVDQTVYAKKPEIKSMKDLEGRSVGTGSPGALLHQLMIALCQKKGVDTSKITFVNVGSSADVFRAVVAGTVDAGPAQIDVYYEQAKYGVHSLSDANMWTELPEYTYQGSFTTTETIAKRRDVVVRILAVYAKLFRFLQSPDSKDAFIQARLTVMKGGDPGQIRREGEENWEFYQKYKPYTETLSLSKERVDYIQKLNMTLGIQKRMLPYEQVVDPSLAAEALKLI